MRDLKKSHPWKSYLLFKFQVKQALDEYGNKLSSDDKERAKNACDETLRWLDSNTLAEKEEIDAKSEEFRQTVQSIMTKLHTGGQQQGGPNCGGQPNAGGFAGGNHPGSYSGPTVEEVD